jgi:hypothetical protein
MGTARFSSSRLSYLAGFALLTTSSIGQGLPRAEVSPLHSAVEAARKTREEAQLQSLKAQIEQKIAQDSKDADSYLDLARVNAYLADVHEMRRTRKPK